MPYNQLVKQGRIKVYRASPAEIQQLLRISVRDLSAAIKNLDISPDWAYTMAYNAVLQTCRALMLVDGYRPRGGEQHATIVAFVEERLGSPFNSQVHLLDQMRRKRHRVIYDISGLIGNAEAEQAIAFAQGFLEELQPIITGQIGFDLKP